METRRFDETIGEDGVTKRSDGKVKLNPAGFAALLDRDLRAKHFSSEGE